MTEAVFNSFSQSIERLAEVLKQPKTVITRDSAVKRFELTFELAWKSAKTYLGGKGVVSQSPRDCLMEAFRLGLIPDNLLWLKSLRIGIYLFTPTMKNWPTTFMAGSGIICYCSAN